MPEASDVIGFPLGQREVTVGETDAYLDAVDAASDRVRTDTFGTSVEGRPLRYAIVGHPDHISADGLEAIRQAIVRMRDPNTPADEVAELAASTPAFLYIAGNVHGTEESGTDASLHVLHDLADRTDCAAMRIVDNAIVFILPTQNPDGREAETRRNAYAFDMNRDWFARTQPETDGKVELLRRYPPLLFVDAHEFGYYRSFFAPNDDPVYHDAPEPVLGWMNDLYAPALAREFRERDWGFFNYGGYDFFMPGYGDTVPANGFMAAAFTLEHYDGAPMEVRERKTHLQFWLLLTIAARNRQRLLIEQHERLRGSGRAGSARDPGAQRPVEPTQRTARGGSPTVGCGTTSCSTSRSARSRPRSSCAACSGWTYRSTGSTPRSRSPTTGRTRGHRSRARSRPAPTGSRWPRRRSTGSS